MSHFSSKTYLSAGCLLVLILAGTMGPAAQAAEPAEIEYHEDVIYGAGGGAPLKLDWARPKQFTEPLPAIIFIHGGGWAHGDKKIHRDEAQAVAKLGYFSATIGYRLAPQHRFPAQVEDCKCAIRYLRANAEELGLDPNRIGAIGFSAGAHLVMMLATTEPEDGLEGKGGWQDRSSAIQAGVSFFGPTNLQSPYPDASRPLVEQFLNSTVQKDPDLFAKASPITYVDAGDPPLLLYQGTKDKLVPFDQASQMVQALTEAGAPGRVEFLLGAGHGWGEPDRERTLKESIRFILRHSKKSTE